MLETGLVLARLGVLTEYEDRLLLADSYAQACTELRAALLLGRMGLRLRRDPANRSTQPQKRPSQGAGCLASVIVTTIWPLALRRVG
jgi:hypothetical protein